jgi:predicted AAA+ superfamily ATPase
MTLRSIIDKNRRSAHTFGQFLILGSASLDLLRQSSESLAGRIIYIEMPAINVIELPETTIERERLWLRGGFPDSLLVTQDAISMEWRRAFIKTYLERDIPQFGPRIPAETLRRLWTMLAHLQGTPLNAAQLASNLSVSGQTIARYIDLLADLFLIRRLIPWHSNSGKRLVRSPKIYIRDSGLLHALLNINSMDDLLSHPIVGTSFEGFAIDNLLAFLPIGSESYFYRTLRGAEIDLVINHPDGRVIAIEIKRSSAPKVEKGFYEACNDIHPTHRYVVYPGNETFPMKDHVTAIGLAQLVELLGGINSGTPV